ncbi:ABC transporter ATP-binding protein [Sphingopyxis kveilinensis]|uniref:ABC transporter ATP-binding protein n=1 Tax=Sphingopyxis kveilinensis TaxID=3114367 RepID=UPI0030CB4614
MIEVRDLRKFYRTRFGEKLVLDKVNFDLRKGERLGVLGRNGAGKSTMIRLVSGAERPTSGTIERRMSVSWPLAFGGAFQPMLTGVDNIRFISRIYEQDFESNLAFVEEFAELGPYLREPVRTYSSGMRARLAFAISMIIEFDCFLIDEIGAVGDARFHDRCNYELFEKRGDRAMIIISHDAGYIRDHCNRWAVLHDGRLGLHDAFDAAYTSYKEVIGATLGAAKPVVSHVNRALMIESSQRAALADERFRIHVQQGDWARDSKDWARAEQEYGAALSLYPYQRSYWVQHGHVTKEQGAFARAEISYRTAAAFGVPEDEVAEFIHFVAARQNDDEPARDIHGLRPAPAGSQPPGAPDVDTFAQLLWPTGDVDERDVLDLLRTCATCDALVVAMIADERFVAAYAAVRHRGETPSAPVRPNDRAALDRDVIRRICCLFTAELGAYADEIKRPEQILCRLIASETLAEWPLTTQALRARLAPDKGACVSA